MGDKYHATDKIVTLLPESLEVLDLNNEVNTT